MPELQQGETFKETTVTDSSGNTVELGETSQQDMEPAKQQPFGLTPKKIALIAGGLAVVVGLFILFGPKPEVKDTADLLEKTGPTYTEDDGYTATPEKTTETTTEPPPVIPVNDYGDELVKGSGSKVSNPYEYLKYSEYEVETLRTYGFTGDEIEYYSQQGKSFDDLIDEVEQNRKQENAEWIASIIDDASDAYKNLMAKSELDGKDTSNRNFRQELAKSYITTKENVDYTKCGCYNYVCWIKVELTTGSTLMQLPLGRYNEIAETGNMLVSYTVIKDENDKVMYIQDLKELTF